MNTPSELKYTSNDEWIKVDGNMGVIGLTDFAQSQLSDIVFVEVVVAEGDLIQKGAACATVESVKAAADIYAPASGVVVAVNEALSDAPETLNSDPYGAGWLIKIELSNSAELGELMDAPGYEKHCEEKQH